MSDKANHYLFKKIKIEYLQILFISFSFAYLSWIGIYGYGADYYYIYHNSNIFIGGYTDRLGWMISTFTLFGVHIGIYLVAFLLAISLGILLIKTTYRYFGKNKILFFTLYIMLLHTWPVIMSTSNAMRQGVAMSLLFIALYFLLSKRFFLYSVFIGLVVVSHNSGIFLVLLLAGVNLSSSQIKKWINSASGFRNFLVIISFLIGLILYFILYLIYPNNEDNRIISGDYRLPFLIIHACYIFVYVKYLYIKPDQIDTFLLICSFIFPVFLLHDFNWQFERLNMMILILYMISFSKIFFILDKKNSLFLPSPLLFSASLLISTASLLFMTFYAGMYNALRVTHEFQSFPLENLHL